MAWVNFCFLRLLYRLPSNISRKEISISKASMQTYVCTHLLNGASRIPLSCQTSFWDLNSLIFWNVPKKIHSVKSLSCWDVPLWVTQLLYWCVSCAQVMPFSLVELRCLLMKVIVYYVITVPVLVHSIVYCYGITIHSSVSVLILFGQPKITIR